LIFGSGRWNRGLLRPLHASTRYCSTSGNGAPPNTVYVRNWSIDYALWSLVRQGYYIKLHVITHCVSRALISCAFCSYNALRCGEEVVLICRILSQDNSFALCVYPISHFE